MNFKNPSIYTLFYASISSVVARKLQEISFTLTTSGFFHLQPSNGDLIMIFINTPYNMCFTLFSDDSKRAESHVEDDIWPPSMQNNSYAGLLNDTFMIEILLSFLVFNFIHNANIFNSAHLSTRYVWLILRTWRHRGTCLY